MSTTAQIIGEVLGAGANAATGGVLGLLGSIGHGVVGYFQAKSQASHELSMGELNLRLIAANTDAAQRLNADQLRASVESTAGSAFVASQQAGMVMQGTHPVIAGLIQLYRPFLCTGLLATEFYFWPQADAELRKFIVISTVNLSSMAVAWWWGNRQFDKFVSCKPTHRK